MNEGLIMMQFDDYTSVHRKMVVLGAEVFAREHKVVKALEAAFPGHKQGAIAIAYELQAGSCTTSRDRPCRLGPARLHCFQQSTILLVLVRLMRCSGGRLRLLWRTRPLH